MPQKKKAAGEPTPAAKNSFDFIAVPRQIPGEQWRTRFANGAWTNRVLVERKPRMTGPQAEVRDVFCEALERQSALARADYLDRACQGKPELRARVEALLRASDEASGFLREPAGQPPATVDEPMREKPGSEIGAYKLLEQIGEGGFGVVFMAEQQRPVRRRVALKVLKPGMDTGQVVARFEAERQALALMDHPNIAQVFDGGESATGRPYFVMELVRGVPITDFCD
jgi:hypothetical protein